MPSRKRAHLSNAAHAYCFKMPGSFMPPGSKRFYWSVLSLLKSAQAHVAPAGRVDTTQFAAAFEAADIFAFCQAMMTPRGDRAFDADA